MAPKGKSRTIPVTGRNQREKEIWLAWRSLVSTGLTKPNNSKTRALIVLFDLLTLTSEEARRLLLGIALDSDEGKSLAQVHEEWAKLSLSVRARLELLRADPDPGGAPEARERAIATRAAMNGTDPEELEDFRKGTKGEYEILCELLEITRRRHLQRRDAVLEGQTIARSHGMASKKATEAVGDLKGETGRFWSRGSTVAAFATIAKQKELTVYLGTDGDFDVATLGRGELYSGAIIQRLDERHGTDEAHSKELRHLATRIPSAQLGSILRQLYSGEHGYTERSDDMLRTELERRLADRVRDGPLARGVTYLAFAFRRADRDVELMSESLGPELKNAAQNRRDKYPSMRDIDYVRDGEASNYERRVRLIEMQGRKEDSWTQSLAVGELDFEGDPELNRREGPSRLERLVEALSNRPVLFVGTSLTDSGLISALARTADSTCPRYALVLSPDFPASLGQSPGIRAARRWLLAQRYLHLGLLPVIAEFPYEIPQALREIASRIEHGRGYEDYEARLRRWTDLLPEHSGITMEEKRRVIIPKWRAAWKEVLKDVVERMPSGSRSERLEAEMWLWNLNSESLHRVAATDGDGRKTSPKVPLFHDGKAPVNGPSQALAVDAFCRGHSVEAEFGPGYGVAFNVVLYGHDGERLPVGVITVVARSGDERLHEFARDRVRRGGLEERMAAAATALLPPL